MTTQELLADLARLGVTLIRAGDTIRIQAPEPPPPAILEALKEHKAALLASFDRLDPDPRPDLVDDSALWRRLLTLAQADEYDSAGLYGVLRGFRSLGAQLAAHGRGLRLRPGEMDEVEYTALALEWLEPHRAQLAALLRRVATERTAA